eukprot:TRINITY_DN91742_c0_g1_i1.p1 TRINITY_DN91742_c0_g1~~TRINITY_DN91742_c0_g1_i1.p1  ORF type:complete len:806 (+),score=171.02 TRINITY_DN91742_c0_g1_i1:82-2418(+)
MLAVACVLSFLSLIAVLRSTLMMTPVQDANPERLSLRLQRLADEHPGSGESSQTIALALTALEERLASLDRRFQQQQQQMLPASEQVSASLPQAQLDALAEGMASSFRQANVQAQPAASISQAQLDALAAGMADAFRKAGDRMQNSADSSSHYTGLFGSSMEVGYRSYWTTTTLLPWQRDINELRGSLERLAHQTDDRFSATLQRILPTAGLKLEESKGHVCRVPPCSRDVKSCKVNGNCCDDLMFEMLVDFSEFLTKQNVSFMVSEGTLLGAVRDQDIIPYTADIDLYIAKDDWEKAELINTEPLNAKGRGYRFMVDPAEHNCARLCAVWQGMPANRAPFDEFFDWNTENLATDLPYYMDIYSEDMDFAVAMKHLIYPPSNVTIRNRTFPAPREQEIYIEARYGSGWRVPDHQARELPDAYPSMQEGQVWSQNMLSLRDAQNDAVLGFRLLERASVDMKTGNVVIRDMGRNMGAPDSAAKEVILKNFKMNPFRQVLSGDLQIVPPDRNEGQILRYILYWVKEEFNSWSEDVTLARLDSGIGEAVEEHIRPIAKVDRCNGAGGDPFKACSQHGIPLEIELPKKLSVPRDALYVGVTVENEGGENRELVVAELGVQESGLSSLTRLTILGILTSFGETLIEVLSTCVMGKVTLEKEGMENIVSKMVLKTHSDMKDALSMLGDWLEPAMKSLEECGAEDRKKTRTINYSLRRLRKGELEYEPGQKLELDGMSIFLPVNEGIGAFRKGKYFQFGKSLGHVLIPPPVHAGMADQESIDAFSR